MKIIAVIPKSFIDQKLIGKIFLIIFLFPFTLYPQSDYFPIEIGNSWTYKENGIDWYNDNTRTISDSITIDGNLCYYYGGMIIFPDSLGRIWRYKNGEMLLWFDFTLAEADSYFYKEGNHNYIVKIYRTQNIRFKPDFVDTDSYVGFSFDDPNAVCEEGYYVFAHSFGLIQYSPGMGIMYLLNSAIIDGKLYTKIDHTKDYVPTKYVLKQNYPNPFNPNTTIEFSLPQTEFTTLKIYNVLGQEVATLVSDKLNIGTYKYEWNASGMASGVYYYKIFTSEWFDVKKMLLIK
jgi:hypothetical protein